MNTTWAKQDLLDRFGRVATVLHHGLASSGWRAVVLVLVRGKTLFFDEHRQPFHRGRLDPLRRSSLTTRQGGRYRHPEIPRSGQYVSRNTGSRGCHEQFVGAAYDAGLQVGLDPLRFSAVMAVESRFNPVAESLMGAKGLMQVIPRHHLDKLLEHGGKEAVLDPMINIALGARILKEYVRRTGSLEAVCSSITGIGGSLEPIRAESLRRKGAVAGGRTQFGRPGVRSSV